MSIKTKITVDNSELKKGLKEAENQANSSMNNIANSVDGVSGGFNGILNSLKKFGPAGKIAAGSIVIIGAAITAVIAGINRLSDKLDNIAKSAKSVNLSTNAFQSLQHAAMLCGVDMDKIMKTMSKITYNMAQADKGTKNVVDGFQALGVSWSELDKMAPEQQLMTIIEAAQKIKDVSKRNKVLLQLFDKKDLQTLNKLMETDFSRLTVNAKNMGIMIDEDAIRLAEGYNDSLGIANQRLVAMVANWELTKKTMQGLKKMALEATGSLNVDDGKVSDQYKAIFEGIGDAADALEQKLKDNDKTEYDRIQQKIKELAKLKAMRAIIAGSMGRTVVNDKAAEAASAAYMKDARKEVLWKEVENRDSRYKVNDRSTWTQRRKTPLEQPVFDKEKIKADQIQAAVKRITEELQKKKKKHEEQLRSYNKELNLKKEIASIEAETGGKLTDEQKVSIQKTLLDLQIARNKEIVAGLNDETSKMSAEFQIQKAILQGDKKRVQMLKVILKLKEQGINITEEQFKKNNTSEVIKAAKDQLNKKETQQKSLDQSTIKKMGKDTAAQNEIMKAQLAGDLDRVNNLKLINELKAKGIQIDEAELKANKQKYQALMDQRKTQQELNLKQSLKDQGQNLINQAMKQAGFSKLAAQQQALRNAEKTKGAKLTQDQIDSIKKLSDLQQQLNDPKNKLNLSGLDTKTNELTARGGFSTGAVSTPKDTVNKQIRDFQAKQVQILNQIHTILKNGGII